ncbi:hypothetical protein GCK72_020693 [Caenorhabditis remanei]|uniref:ZP domain-containing protein n=1 Tax=Caenorhabditis remanei TaxID=31234 RepID=A0A6A5GHH3_CAERE|nr:hypothetical protein GCK72_020693 [Caenorhabditis remanei]KAF1754133.1 hypothetical protein GCK72_020693 [Caenorhabditis remanei]
MRPVFPLFLVLFGPCLAVKPVWKTPVSEPNPNANVDELKGHSNVAKRAQPNYYTRPEQVSIPDYRSPRQRLPSPPIHQKYQQVPPHQITSGGSFRPFAWVGPQPKAGSPQTSYYEKAPNKGQFPNGLPPLPPNWQQYPVQMIWIPDTPGQSTGPYPYYPGPAPVGPGPVGPLVSVSTGSYGLYGPTVTTEEPMKPSAYPETYTGTLAHSPAVNPVTSTIPYEPPNPYGGRQTEVSPSSTPSDSGTYPSAPTSYPSTEDTTNPYEQSRSTGQNYSSSNIPTASGGGPSTSTGKTVNPTIRPGPQEPSGGGGTTVKTRLPLDADETRDNEPGSNGRNSEKTKPTKATPIPTRPNSGNSGNTPSTRTGGIPATPSRPQDSRDKETTLFEMTTNPFGETIGGKTVPPIYLGSDEEDETPPEDISKVTETPESSEHTQIPGSPGSQSTQSTKSPDSSESEDDDRERETSSSETATPTPQEEEDEMMKNFFPRPVSSQAYQPPGHQPEDFTSHINVNFKKPKGKGGCVTPPCRGVDTDKISLYKPDRDNEGSGPTLVISNAAKDDASRAGYKPAPPPVNPYIPPPPPPHPEEEYATPYTVPPGKQPFPPFGGPATPPRALIPVHNFPPPSTFPPDEDYHETTADTIHPTAQTIATRFVAPTTTTTPRPVESTTTEEDTPEYVPPAIVHMTASTPRDKNPPTYVPLHPETSASTQNPTTPRETGETQTPASITRQPEFPSRATPPVGGNFQPGSTTSVSNPTTNGFITEVYTDRERTDSGESYSTSTPSSSNSEPPSSGAFSTSSSPPAPTTTGGWIYTTIESSSTTTPESEYSTASIPSEFPTLSTERFTPSDSTPPTSGPTTPEVSTNRFTPSSGRSSESTTPSSGIFSTTPDQFETVTSTDRFRPSEFATSSPTPPTPQTPQVVTASFPPSEASSPGILPNTNPPRGNPYAPPEGAPRVPNRLIGKPRILCLEDGISFEVKTILPLSGEVFANDRKRIPECQKTFTEDAKPKLFLPFSTCGVKNVGEQVDSRAQYHMQVVLIIDQGNGTNTLQSFMAQCVHQKVNYNKQVLPKRIEEALEELRLVPSKLEQKASMPSVQMQIVVDEGHHKLGAEVSAADIGMPLALKWSMVPESDAYGMHIRNCKVVDAVGKIDHTLIDEQGCSADLQIIDHPHYDTYHDTASAHMWAFKVPDMSSLQIKCDIFICSNIKSSVTNTTSCEDIPSPPFCADVVTSPPNSILSDASSFIKHRRASVTSSEVSTSTQSVRTSICLSKTCRPDFSEEVRICVNTQLATTSTGLSVAFLLFAISFQIIARTKRP